MRILITGGKGRLGGKLHQLLGDQAAHAVLSTDVDDLDITDFGAVRAQVQDFKPDLVLHCAAWTNVDGCALEPEKALVINGYGSGNLAAAAASVQAAMLYVSSNEVFDGERSGRGYYEYDATNPINAYGYSKFVGEQEVTRLNPKHYIVRTAWLFAHGGKNFMQSIINAAEAGKPLRVVVDEIANPTYTDDLAEAIVQLIGTRRYGTYHLTNSGQVSRWRFARYILDRTGYGDTPIQKIAMTEWQRPSTPPAHCPLENIAGSQMGIRLRSWGAAVDAFLEREGLIVNG